MNTYHNIMHKAAAALTVAVVAVMGLAGCARPSVAEQVASLDEASALIDRADYGSAQSICDEVRRLQTAATAAAEADGGKDATMLGRLSILYMKLADATSREVNIEYAYQCYLEAYAADSVAAHRYYNSLSVEELPQGILLAGIVRNAVAPPDDVGAIDVDSLP